MSRSQFVTAAAMAAVLAVTSGCVSAGGPGKITVTTVEGAYEAPKTTALPNDIKTILAAGGLDVTDPSAPVAGTKVTEMAQSAARADEVKELVASLESKDAKAADAPIMSLAATAKQAVTMPVAPRPQEVATATFSYPDIGMQPAPSAMPAKPAAEPRKRQRMAVAAATKAEAAVPRTRRF